MKLMYQMGKGGRLNNPNALQLPILKIRSPTTTSFSTRTSSWPELNLGAHTCQTLDIIAIPLLTLETVLVVHSSSLRYGKRSRIQS